jgi:hypothetical protein
MTSGSVLPFEGVTSRGSERAVTSSNGSSHVVRLGFGDEPGCRRTALVESFPYAVSPAWKTGFGLGAFRHSGLLTTVQARQ